MLRLNLAIAVLFLCPSLASASTWLIDADRSKVHFEVSHPLSSVTGEFHKFDGVLELHEKKITRSRFSAVIHTASVDTGIKALDEELCSDDFLNVRRYPTMTFKTKKITQNGEQRLKITGDLRIQDVTRKVVLDAQVPSAPARDRLGKMRRSTSAATRISRKDFGLNWNSMMTTGLGDDIDIRLDIELVEK